MQDAGGRGRRNRAKDRVGAGRGLVSQPAVTVAAHGGAGVSPTPTEGC